MVKFIESELILLKKEIDEMWTLVYNQLDRAVEIFDKVVRSVTCLTVLAVHKRVRETADVT